VHVFVGGTTELQVPCPSVPCRDTSAESAQDALYEVPVSSKIHAAITGILATSPIATFTYGMDGHFGNEKLYAFHEAADDAMAAHCKVLCFNHQHHVSEGVGKDLGQGYGGKTFKDWS
jgi:hypothetical protein